MQHSTTPPMSRLHRWWQLLTRDPPANKLFSSDEPEQYAIDKNYKFPDYPYTNANWWSRIWYNWCSPLVEAGYQHPVQLKDLFDLPQEMKSAAYITELEDIFATHKDQSYSFGRSLLQLFKSKYVIPMVWYKLIILAFMLVRPLILRQMLSSITVLATTTITDASERRWLTAEGFFYGFLLAAASLTQAMTIHKYYFIGVMSALSARGAVIGILFRKAMRVDFTARNQHNAPMSNLASVDADNLMNFLWGQVHELWASPLLIILSVVGLVMVLGYSAFVGIALLIGSLFLTGKLTQMMRRSQTVMMQKQDERVRRVTEVLTSMKIVKLYGYENVMKQRIFDIRKEQERIMLKINIINALNRCLGLSVPLCVSLATFATYTGLGHPLDATTAFVSLLLFTQLKEPLSRLPEAINLFVRCLISQQRIENFLRLPEKPSYQLENKANGARPPTPKQRTNPNDIIVRNAHFSWATGKTDEELIALPTGSASPAGTPKQRKHKSKRYAQLADEDESIELAVIDDNELDDSDMHLLPPPSAMISQHRQMSAAQQFAATAMTKLSRLGSDESEYDHTMFGGNSDAAASGLREHLSMPQTPRSALQRAQTGDLSDVKHLHLDQRNASSLSPHASPMSSAVTHPGTPRGVSQRTTPRHARTNSDAMLEIGALNNITLRIPAGKLVMIIGEVGSGKSSLLHAIMGEMNKLDGSVQAPRSIAYAAQSAWLMTATIRDNVLFGLPYDAEHYRKTLRVCALERDLLQWPHGDQTLVGESGVNLSGGQKARMVLARAVYSQSDVYLFDEPLSAVDSHVGSHLFTHVLGSEGILADRTRVLVTHQIQFCHAPGVHQIVVMEHGRIKTAGTFKELVKQGIDFEAIVTASKGGLQKDDEPGESAASEHPVKLAHDHCDAQPEQSKDKLQSADVCHSELTSMTDTGEMIDVTSPASSTRNSSSSTVTSPIAHRSGQSPAGKTTVNASVSNGIESEMADVDYSDESTANKKEVSDNETMSRGNNTSKLARVYFRSVGGVFGWMAIFVLLIMAQAAAVGSDSFLAFWSTNNAAADDASHPEHDATMNTILPYSNSLYIDGYALLVITSGLLMLARNLKVAFGTFKAGNSIHVRLMDSLLYCPLWFYENTPSGRILNRAAKDQELVDAQLPSVIQDVLACSVTVLGILTIVCAIAPMALPFIVSISVVYWVIQKYYRPVSRELKRLEAVSRSPVYQHFSECCNGLVTIRSFEHNGAVQRMQDECHFRIDNNTRIYKAAFVVNRWLGVRLEVIGAGVVLIACCFALVLAPKIGVGLVGLSVTSTLALSGNLNWMVRQLSELEVQLNAVERITEYIMLESEETQLGRQLQQRVDSQKKQLHTQSLSLTPQEPEASWPRAGSIELRDLSVSYKSAPGSQCVLHHLNFTIKGGEKIGIVGRTGAGKSTITLALFRLLTWQTGTVLIDGVDTATVPLATLRSRMSIVPQDPTLFRATVRFNLDPQDEWSDAKIWDLLERVDLKKVITELPGQLSYEVADGGQNFSLGQRQLLCMARAIVRKSRIILMDEATASLDFSTDQMIRRMISTEFKNCTVITIAHRLGSVLDADRILVMNKGLVAEFDSPANLLANPQGFLSQLVADTNAVTTYAH